jgi:hypothetical protein
MANPLRSIFSRQFIAVITGMLLVIMVIVWWNTKPNTRVVKAAEQVFAIADAVRKSFINKIDYWGLDTEMVINNNILTNRFYKDNNLLNALGKPVLIGSGEEGSMVMPGVRSFEIVYGELTQNECIALATYDYEQQEELGLLKITIRGDESREFGWVEEGYKLPVSRPEARKICKNGSKVIWTME